MRKVVTLFAFVGLLFAVGIFLYVSLRKGVPEALDLGFELHSKIYNDGRIDRIVGISGRLDLPKVIAPALGIDENAGWYRMPSSNSGFNQARFIKSFAPGDKSWTWTKVLECHSHTGLFHRQTTFRERFLPDFDERVEKACGVLKTPAKECVESVPLALTIQMPEEITEAPGMTINPDQSEASFTGRLGDLLHGREVKVVSVGTSPWCYFFVPALIIALIVGAFVLHSKRQASQQIYRPNGD